MSTTLKQSRIPKTLIQTSPSGIPGYVVDMTLKHCPGWSYVHFSDDDIYEFFKENPLEEFPDIVKVFESFSHGAHRADLFRYYYLYIKGGVYLDSDAVLETDIATITADYSFVSINSYHTNSNLLFNGFIAVEPKHPIMYLALKDAYSIQDADLKKDYHRICKNLYSIVAENKSDDVKIYQEERTKRFQAGVRTFTDNRQLILTHYCYIRLIPKTIYSSPLAGKFYSFIFSYKLLYKLHRMVQKAEVKIMKRNHAKQRENLAKPKTQK